MDSMGVCVQSCRPDCTLKSASLLGASSRSPFCKLTCEGLACTLVRSSRKELPRTCTFSALSCPAICGALVEPLTVPLNAACPCKSSGWPGRREHVGQRLQFMQIIACRLNLQSASACSPCRQLRATSAAAARNSCCNAISCVCAVVARMDLGIERHSRCSIRLPTPRFPSAVASARSTTFCTLPRPVGNHGAVQAVRDITTGFSPAEFATRFRSASEIPCDSRNHASLLLAGRCCEPRLCLQFAAEQARRHIVHVTLPCASAVSARRGHGCRRSGGCAHLQDAAADGSLHRRRSPALPDRERWRNRRCRSSAPRRLESSGRASPRAIWLAPG